MDRAHTSSVETFCSNRKTSPVEAHTSDTVAHHMRQFAHSYIRLFSLDSIRRCMFPTWVVCYHICPTVVASTPVSP